jgi:hypothetical protein
MSTLRLTTLSNQGGTASVPSDTVINGTAKAWVNFNGTGTVAIRASFNVSSITDNGTGQYRVNFTNALADANYSSVASSQEYTADAIGQAAKTTTQCSIWNVDSRNYSYIDTAGMNVVILR